MYGRSDRQLRPPPSLSPNQSGVPPDVKRGEHDSVLATQLQARRHEQALQGFCIIQAFILATVAAPHDTKSFAAQAQRESLRDPSRHPTAARRLRLDMRVDARDLVIGLVVVIAITLVVVFFALSCGQLVLGHIAVIRLG